MTKTDFKLPQRTNARTLRIALVTETYAPEVNGVAMTLSRMVQGLLARGHQIQIIRPRQSRNDDADQSPNHEEVLVRGAAIPGYDGLHFGLPARARLHRLWSRQRPDAVHVATEGPLGWSAVSAARRLGIPVTSDFHTNFDHYSGHYGVGWLRRPVAAYLQQFHNRTAATFVPTRELSSALAARGYRKVEVIARGVDTAHFNPSRRSAELRATWGLGESGLAVIWVGRLAPEKNIPLVLAAFEKIRLTNQDARLIIVGDGPLRKSLQARHPDYVFAGMRVGEDLAAHYASGDLFLFSSLSETYGNVTLEAMASGLCVVAYDYAAAAEVITGDHTGLLVPPGDERAFVAQSLRAAESVEMRRRLGSAARARSESLDWECIFDRFERALQRVILHAQTVRDEQVLPFRATMR